MKIAIQSPGWSPRARSTCASRFDRSSSWRYVTIAPVPPMMIAGWSGIVSANVPGYTPRVYRHYWSLATRRVTRLAHTRSVALGGLPRVFDNLRAPDDKGSPCEPRTHRGPRVLP